MSDIIIRKLSLEELNELDRLVKIKKFPSRESYLRHLIKKELKDEFYTSSYLKYHHIVEELLHYMNASNEIIKESNELISFLLSKIDLK